MRAGIVLEALSEYYNVFLLVVPLTRSSVGRPLPSAAGAWCADYRVAPAPSEDDHRPGGNPAQESVLRFVTPETVSRASRVFRGVDFQAVHVLRTFASPFAEQYLSRPSESRPHCSLDMDDIDSIAFRRIGRLYDAAGDSTNARWHRAEAKRFEVMEKEYLPRFDRIYVGSEADHGILDRSYELPEIVLLPNAVRIPQSRARQRHADFTFLFVGMMAYYPNDDAVWYFCREVLPILRQLVQRRFRLLVVGPRPAERIRALAAGEEVSVIGEVPDPAPYYRRADVAVVPIRAGGGTRIKILEAASHGCPIVSTTAGAEGLKVTGGRELFLADTPAEFAERCALLMKDAGERRRLAREALRWVRANHSLEQVRQAVRPVFRGDGGLRR